MNTQNDTGPEKSYLNMSWQERFEFTRAVSAIPALMCMVFLRLNLGYRIIKIHWLVLIGGSMCILPAVAPQLVRPHGWVFVLVGVAMPIIGVVVRHRRWNELLAGRRLHTFSPGTMSLVEFLPLPGLFKVNRRVYRILDPLAVAIFGLILFPLSHGMTVLSIFCASGLAVFEDSVWRAIVKRDMDLHDAYIASQVLQEVMEMSAAGESEEAQQKVLMEVGLPTGTDARLKKQIQIRKAKAPKAAPDNLAAQEAARA
jgi:hypothetical protein